MAFDSMGWGWDMRDESPQPTLSALKDYDEFKVDREAELENATEMEIIFSKTFATKVEDNGHDHGETNTSLEDIEVDNIIPIEKEHNKKEKKLLEGNEKTVVPNKSKVGAAIGMQHRLNRIVDVVESFVPPWVATTSRIGVDPPGCNIMECLGLLKSLAIELGSELDMFVVLGDDEVRVAWLEDQLKCEH
ncbi:LOW QUALITY PROTEIN: hypothetical protein Cgig2_033885 [Carnegiea gigantea]|uniref:Uncharacterized protein n=1 Tax=Carnegiea gigantea TaxID=171969 RepID=A0A9Q1JLP7_9CARY|nr:LOW QUALITY PROTEIN: hypothetical protein Cgig2_033885 [Carnegiea gigantea]